MLLRILCRVPMPNTSGQQFTSRHESYWMLFCKDYEFPNYSNNIVTANITHIVYIWNSFMKETFHDMSIVTAFTKKRLRFQLVI